MSDTTVTITAPAEEELAAQLAPLERKVAAMKIIDAKSHKAAQDLGIRITQMQKFVRGIFADPKKKAAELHKSMTSAENRYLIPLDKMKTLNNARLNDYEQREKARAEEEARVRQIEANRIEQERQLKEAVSAEQAGDTQLAEAIVDSPIQKPVVVAAPKMAEVKGSSTRDNWKAELVNLLALVRYVAENPDAIGLLEPNASALNALARALKENMRIPGVRPVNTPVRSFRTD